MVVYDVIHSESSRVENVFLCYCPLSNTFVIDLKEFFTYSCTSGCLLCSLLRKLSCAYQVRHSEQRSLSLLTIKFKDIHLTLDHFSLFNFLCGTYH